MKIRDLERSQLLLTGLRQDIRQMPSGRGGTSGISDRQLHINVVRSAEFAELRVGEGLV